MSDERPFIVIGGGWAGLAAAMHLATAGAPVTLLEAAPQLGGRARATVLGGHRLDNGQHLMIGAYRETLALLALAGIAEDTALLRLPLTLEVWSKTRRFALGTAPLPAPLHLAMGIVSARGLRFSERLAALRLSLGLALRGFRPRGHTTVLELLETYHQPRFLIDALWEPLCLATLNLTAEAASAEVFLRVLRDSFAYGRHDADLLLPRGDLGAFLPGPARRYIEDHGGQVLCGRRVTALSAAGGRIRAVETPTGRLASRGVILATGAPAAARLLAGHAQTNALAETIGTMAHEPITTVYLEYPPTVKLPRPMLGLIDGMAQWVFDRRHCGEPGMMAVVVSGAGAHTALDKGELAARIAAELAGHFPHWPTPTAHWVIRERRATFRCDAADNAKRPAVGSGMPGLWLAGDYTATGYPATLEGAVRSGVQCARLALTCPA